MSPLLLALACTGGPDPQDSSPGAADGEGLFIAVPMLEPEADGPGELRVYDQEGEVVWAAEPSGRIVTLQTRFAPDGSGLWVWTQDPVDGTAEVPFLLQHLDWSGQEIGRIEGFGHTAFALLPDGGVLVLDKTLDEVQGQAALIDQVVEYDASGQRLGVVWTVTDDLDASELVTVAQPSDKGLPVDWFHANSLEVDERGHIFVSLSDVDAVVELDAQGQLVQGLDTQGYFVDHQPPDPPLERPHSFEPLPDGGWLVFNRRVPEVAEFCSEAVELHLDSSGQLVERGWSWHPEDCPKTTMLGSAHLLPEGRRLVSFGSAGRIVLLGPEDEIELQIELSLGQAFGQPDWSTTPPG